MALIISPPELVAFSRRRYLDDLVYRTARDVGSGAESIERWKLLFVK